MRRSAALGNVLAVCGFARAMETAGSRPAARHSGAGERASELPVVLLHGQPGSGDDWGAVAARLSPRRRVLAPDRPGYGSNVKEAGGFAANVDDLMARLDAEGIDRAVIVGHSWAAGVAFIAGAEHPERVGSVVAVTPVVPGHFDWTDRLLATSVVGVLSARFALGAVRVFGTRDLFTRVVSVVDPKLTPAVVRGSMSALRIRRVARSIAVEARATVREYPSFVDRLAGLHTPVTVVAGRGDRIVPTDAIADLVSRLPSARLTTVDGGHLLPLVAPDALAGVIASAPVAAEVAPSPSRAATPPSGW